MVNIMQEIHGIHYCLCHDPSQAHCAACGEDYCGVCGGRIVAQPAQPEPDADADAATPEDGDGETDGERIRLQREIERDTAATRIRLVAQNCAGCGSRLVGGRCAYGCSA